MSQRQVSDSVELIVDAVAEHEGRDPIELTPPLAEVIDPEALDRLLRTRTGEPVEDVGVRFTYRGHDVVVDSNGNVDVQ